MNNAELKAKVNSAMYTLIKNKGYATSVDVLMQIGVLAKVDYENWRFGKTDCLESVCNVNLKKLSSINKTMRDYAAKQGLKPSWTDYRKWGNGENRRLRFSKSGDDNIERAYATHYVVQKTTDETVAP